MHPGQAAAGELPHEPLGWVPPAALPPLVLVAHPFSNSLPSALEALAALQQEGLRGRAVYLASAAAGSPQGEAGWAALRGAVQVGWIIAGRDEGFKVASTQPFPGIGGLCGWPFTPGWPAAC